MTSDKFKPILNWLFNQASHGQDLRRFVLMYNSSLNQCSLHLSESTGKFSFMIHFDSLESISCSKSEYNKLKSYIKKVFSTGRYKNNIRCFVYFMED